MVITRRPTRSIRAAALMAAILLPSVSPPSIKALQSPAQASALQVFEIRPNVHMIAGAGGNITVQVGADGVVLVDSGSIEQASAVIDAVKRLTAQPIRYIINTGPGADHVGGNEIVARAGVSLFLRENGGQAMTTNEGGAAIVGTEDLLTRMSAPDFVPHLPAVAWPTETFTRRYKDLFLNREAIQVIRQRSASTDSDAIVMFRRSDVIATGDIVHSKRFPHLDLAQGGSIQGEIDALNALLDLTVPSIPLPWLEEGGTRVVPGHGRAVEEAEIVEYRDMVTVIRDRVQDMIERGQTVEQIQAANPTLGYRTRYGTDSGPWTTAMFVDAVYRSLTAQTQR